MKSITGSAYRQSPKKHCVLTFYLMIAVCMLFPGLLHAQLKGTHLLGDMGLQSGSQAPPSIGTALAVYNYHTTKFIDANDNKISAESINMFLLGLGGSIVTNSKILGGNYGASILIGFASSELEGNLVSNKSSLAFTDLYIQPLQLGWKIKQADITAGYALYIPTGEYELGGNNNAGLGMWTNELSAGSTLYFDDKKEWNFSTLLSYAFNSKKKNTGDNEIRAGNLLSIEGGAGKSWYKPVGQGPLPMIINTGLIYYMQFKTTGDKMNIPAIGNSLFDLSNKDHIYALGAEANIFIPRIRSSILVRWIGEIGAKNRTEGNSFFITLAPFTKFLEQNKNK